MADEIIGISVLQATWIANVHRLWFLARRSDAKNLQGWIFIAEESASVPDKFPDRPEGCNYIWRFRRNGNLLDCWPSVNWISCGFHNAGRWETECVEMTFPDRPWDPNMPEQPREQRGSAIHYDLNWCETDPARRVQLIAEWRQQGVLR